MFLNRNKQGYTLEQVMTYAGDDKVWNFGQGLVSHNSTAKQVPWALHELQALLNQTKPSGHNFV